MIKLITVGQVKEDFFKGAVNEYLKRLTKYTKIEIIEVKDYTSDDKSLELTKESELILKQINDKDFVVTLEIEGAIIDSFSFSKKIDEWQSKNSNICFIIGGSSGLHDSIKTRSNYALSFSMLTFPHQLFRIIVLEQIYRAFKIIKNESYHK